MNAGLSLEGPSAAPRSGGPAKQLVILLHGWGADGDDLIGLAPYWGELLPDAVFVSPHAPFPCDMGFGRQWFSLADRTPEVIMAEVRLVAPMIDAFIDDRLAAHGLKAPQLAVVGFSQGTMMALHAGPQRKHRLAGILGYSGLLADPAALKGEAVQKPPVLLIHGDQDDLIPVQALFGAAQGLAAAEIPVEWHISPGIPHGIGPDGLELGLAFLKRVLPG